MEQELQWAQKIDRSFDNKPAKPSKSLNPLHPEKEKYLHQLVNTLWNPFDNGRGIRYRPRLLGGAPLFDRENAFMGFGGQLSITSALLNNAESENELAFVICHELGHFVHRDVIRGLSTKLVLQLFQSFIGLGGADLSAINTGLNASVLSFSRSQETTADEFAIDCVAEKYGHINGFETFFKRMAKKSSFLEENAALKYLSTHPLSTKRIEHLNNYSASKVILKEGEITPLPNFNLLLRKSRDFKYTKIHWFF